MHAQIIANHISISKSFISNIQNNPFIAYIFTFQGFYFPPHIRYWSPICYAWNKTPPWISLSNLNSLPCNSLELLVIRQDFRFLNCFNAIFLSWTTASTPSLHQHLWYLIFILPEDRLILWWAAETTLFVIVWQDSFTFKKLSGKEIKFKNVNQLAVSSFQFLLFSIPNSTSLFKNIG